MQHEERRKNEQREQKAHLQTLTEIKNQRSLEKYDLLLTVLVWLLFKEKLQRNQRIHSCFQSESLQIFQRLALDS